MKRCFGKALILALIASIVLTPVMAQASEVVGERVEAAVMWATDAGDTGLSVEDEPIVSGQTPVEAAVVYSSVEKGESPRELEFEITSAELSAPESATGIRISAETLSIGVEEQYTALTVVAEPEGSLISGVTWRSGNEKTVMVDPATGAVTGLKKGTATIYATTAEGLEAACKVKVQSNPTAITVEPAKITISKGMTSALTVSVSGGASGTITYASSNPEIVSVDANGTVTALSTGTATVVAKTYNGKKAKCKVKVMNEAAALSFPQDTLTIAVGESASLTPTALDAGGKKTVAEVTFAIDPASPDASCIALDPRTGAITPQHTGKAVVTATTHNDIAASCNVVVANAPADIALHPDSVTIGIGEIYALTAEPIPPSGETECVTTLTWASSNKKIAAVNAQGQIKGLKTGSCTIRVATDNGKTADCKVKVVKAPKKISISPAVGALRVGKTGKYKITLSPKGSGGSVTYASSDPSIATVDDTGVVTAVAVGEVYIGVATYNGKKAMAKLVVSAAEEEGGKTPSEKAKFVINLAKKQIGKPYIYGSGYADEEDPRGFDCSGLVYWVYKQAGVTLLDSAYRQGYDTRYTRLTMSELSPGDVIFFNTNTTDGDLSDHSAIFIGEGNFIHASSTANKVIISNLSTPGSYYYRAFSWGHHVL